MKLDPVRAAARNDVPVYTASVSGDTQSQLVGWSPSPTQDPLVHGLVKRQSNPRICGYEDADRRLPITCRNASHVCVSDDLMGVVGCCDPEFLGNCAFPTTCVNKSQSDECDEDCRIDPVTVNCFAFDDPLQDCATGVYDFGTIVHTALICNYNTEVTIHPTYTNPLVGEEVTAVSLIPLRAGSEGPSDLLDPDLSTADVLSSNTLITPPSDDGVGFPTGSVETVSIDGGDGDSDDGVNIGAIVGGVVGGLVVVSIFSCIIAFLVLRHRRQKHQDMLTAASAGPHVFGQKAETPEQQSEMPVQQSMLSPDQRHFGSTSTSEPITLASMSTSEPILLDGTPAFSPKVALCELSPTTIETR